MDKKNVIIVLLIILIVIASMTLFQVIEARVEAKDMTPEVQARLAVRTALRDRLRMDLGYGNQYTCNLIESGLVLRGDNPGWDDWVVYSFIQNYTAIREHKYYFYGECTPR